MKSNVKLIRAQEGLRGLRNWRALHQAIWARMGAILSRTGRMKPKEKDSGSHGGSRRPSGQNSRHHGGRDQARTEAAGELSRAHSAKSVNAGRSQHQPSEQKEKRHEKQGKGRPPTIVIKDEGQSRLEHTSPTGQDTALRANAVDAMRMKMIQDGIHSHKNNRNDVVSA